MSDDIALLESDIGIGDKEAPCWIVWERAADGGRPHLRAIDTSEGRAERHAAYLRECARQAGEPVPDILVEESKLNHLYAQNLIDAIIRRSSRARAARGEG